MQQRHPNLIKLGNKIRECRKKRGYSQELIAAQADLDRAYMGRVERGETNISFQNLVRIALALKVELGALIPTIKELKNPD